MVTEKLANGMKLVYLISHTLDSRIHLRGAEDEEVYCWHFTVDQYLLAIGCLNALRQLATTTQHVAQREARPVRRHVS